MNGAAFAFAPRPEPIPPDPRGPLCGLPLDSQHFDASSLAPVPPRGRQVVLARFELPPQYCGHFENFSQFTDLHARDHGQIQTLGLRWLILVNHRPLDPYLDLQHIINPWGFGGFPVNIRLDLDAKVEFVVRNEDYDLDVDGNDPLKVHSLGGRIVGRYWYNPAYGDVARRRQ